MKIQTLVVGGGCNQSQLVATVALPSEVVVVEVEVELDVMVVGMVAISWHLPLAPLRSASPCTSNIMNTNLTRTHVSLSSRITRMLICSTSASIRRCRSYHSSLALAPNNTQVDLFNDNVKVKMSRREFIRNNAFMDYDDEYLMRIYDNVWMWGHIAEPKRTTPRHELGRRNIERLLS